MLWKYKNRNTVAQPRVLGLLVLQAGPLWRDTGGSWQLACSHVKAGLWSTLPSRLMPSRREFSRTRWLHATTRAGGTTLLSESSD
jgi:hypothetical protein